LANHKSALKRFRQNEKKKLRNKHVTSTLRTFIKRVREAVAGKDATLAKEALAAAIPEIDAAALKASFTAPTHPAMFPASLDW